MGTAPFPRMKERLMNLGAQLSGGEQQMRSIGRAQKTHPGLIVLQGSADEVADSPALATYLGV